MSPEQTNFIVEISEVDGIEEVSWRSLNPEELKAQSNAALNAALEVISEMAQRIAALNDRIPLEFSEVDVQFGVKLGYEAGIILSKASTDANLSVTLKWQRPK